MSVNEVKYYVREIFLIVLICVLLLTLGIVTKQLCGSIYILVKNLINQQMFMYRFLFTVLDSSTFSEKNPTSSFPCKLYLGLLFKEGQRDGGANSHHTNH